ncbi:transcriptional regulator [Clostridia bacterium]|nr:transcriptional regulator [Clostridia bacterium]
MFFEKLRELCTKNKTTPTAVTIDLGYSRGSMSHWKNGSTPNGDILLKFADYFDVSVDYLLRQEEPTRPHTGYVTGVNVSLADDEQELLETYRKLKAFNKGVMFGKLQMLLETAKTQDSEGE